MTSNRYKVDATIPFVMETHMHTAGQICVWCVLIASGIYAIVIHKFGPVLCISISMEKGIMKLTLIQLILIS